MAATSITVEELEEAGFVQGLPSIEAVKAHAKAHPQDQDPGGVWVAIDRGRSPEGPYGLPVRPIFVTLLVVDGEIHLWNGFSFTQSLPKTRWGSRTWYRPATRVGLPVASED